MISEFQTSDVSRALVLHVGFTSNGSLWDEMGMRCGAYKLELKSQTGTRSQIYTQILTQILIMSVALTETILLLAPSLS